MGGNCISRNPGRGHTRSRVCIEKNESDVAMECRDWWKYVIIYQIYPRSFQDCNGDGVGDIQGIISRLDHFVFLNVGAIWISPIYKSPMVDHGYDISDFNDIDPVFGTLNDFDQLIAESHKRNIKVIMDFVPNHTSNQHPWFIESCKGAENNRYDDYYIWKDGKKNECNGSIEPPNNWISLFGGSAWTWSEQRQQYYLHTFAPEQPDLNYRNKTVLKEMQNILKFWIKRGVDGFRVDAPVHLIKHEGFLDEPRSVRTGVSDNHPDYLDHIYTSCQPEVHDVMLAFRNVFNKYYCKTGKHIFMAAEVYQELEALKFYDSGSDMPLNLSLVTIKDKLSGLTLKDFIFPWVEGLKCGKWPNFVLGNHDFPRLATRLGERYVDAMNVLLLLLPGTPTTYYGEEIGMTDVEVDQTDIQDPSVKNLGSMMNRDACRSPMQWDESTNAGFSRARKTWLPVHPMFCWRNVKNQVKEGPCSHINIYRAASMLRQDEVFKCGLIDFSIVNENVFSFWRYTDHSDGQCCLVTMNVGEVNVSCDYSSKYSNEGVVILNSTNPDARGALVSLVDLNLDVGQCIVLKLVFS